MSRARLDVGIASCLVVSFNMKKGTLKRTSDGNQSSELNSAKCRFSQRNQNTKQQSREIEEKQHLDAFSRERSESMTEQSKMFYEEVNKGEERSKQDSETELWSLANELSSYVLLKVLLCLKRQKRCFR
jgi:hypothetical protein